MRFSLLLPTQTMLRIILSLACAGTVVACGGGGGGGGGNSGDSGSDSQYGVRVLHGAIDGAPVDVVSSAGSTIASQVFFADSKGYRPIPSGAQLITITRALNPANTLASLEVTSTGKDRFSILLSGDNKTFGIQARLIEDSIPADISGALVRFVNGATGAAALTFSAGAEASAQVAFRSNSEYVPVTPGSVTIRAQRTADGQVASSIQYTFLEGKAYTVFVAGEVGYYTKGRVFVDN